MLLRSLFVESKKLRVFDFDDTLVKTTSFIYVTNKGKTRKLTLVNMQFIKKNQVMNLILRIFKRLRIQMR